MARHPGSQSEILTSQEAREFLKIGRTKLWELTRTAEIPAYRIGQGRTSGLRYKRSDLMRWLEGNRINHLDEAEEGRPRARIVSAGSRSGGPHP